MVGVDEDLHVSYCSQQWRNWGALFTFHMLVLLKSALAWKNSSYWM